MSQRDARLQVPIDKEVLDKLQLLAYQLGFDSVPAMIRFWAKSEINNLVEPEDDKQERAKKIVRSYLLLILELAPESSTPANVLNYVKRTLNRTKPFFVDPLPNQATSDNIFDT